MIRASAVLIAVILASANGWGAEIRLRSQCEASGAIVTLGDLAEIFGDDAAQRGCLAAMELGPAPAPGQQRYFRLRELQDALWSRGVDLAAHQFSGYGQTVVTRRREEPAAVEAAPAAAAEPAKKEAEKPPELTVPVVVPVRPIPRGVVIRPEDLQMSVAPPAKARDVFSSFEEVTGRETTRPLAEGRPMDRDALRSPMMVRRGEVVTLVASAPGLKVKMAARAREQGAMGQPITVETLSDRRVLLARVVGFQEAEVSRVQPRPGGHAENSPQADPSRSAVR